MSDHRALLAELEAILGTARLLRSAEDLRHYGQDWSGVLEPHPLAIALPGSTAEVSHILKLCLAAQLGVVPSGGRTGLSGGATAASGELVISLAKMNRLQPVDVAARTVRAQAGAITQAVHEHCLRAGLVWPVDFASKGSSQVGGNLSTNAGGIRVIRYGSARNWVQSIELVLASGEVLELNGELEKNNAGYDLRQLVIGSEGTLGVITEATLRLAPPPGRTEVLFFGMKDMRAVVQLFADARQTGLPILAFECLDQASYLSSLKAQGLRPPVAPSASAFVLLELEDPSVPALDAWLASLFERRLIEGGTLAQSPREAMDFWRVREGVAESVLSGQLVHQHDVSVPLAALAEFSEAISEKYAELTPEFRVFIFGHIGDGNLHVFLQKPTEFSPERFHAQCEASDQALFSFIRQFGGSVSAEHGVGVLKKNALPFSRSSSEIEIMRGIKRAFDPFGILNPGKIF